MYTRADDEDLKKNVERLKGPKGTTVYLKVEKPNGDIKIISIVRTPVPSPRERLLYVNQGDKKIAIIQMPSFYQDSGRKMIQLLMKASRDKADSLLLDVSFNLGGSLGAVLEILRALIARGNLLGQYTGTSISSFFEHTLYLLQMKIICVIFWSCCRAF